MPPSSSNWQSADPSRRDFPYTRWTIDKLARFLAVNERRHVLIGRRRLRALLRDAGVSFDQSWTEIEPTHRGPVVEGRPRS